MKEKIINHETLSKLIIEIENMMKDKELDLTEQGLLLQMVTTRLQNKVSQQIAKDFQNEQLSKLPFGNLIKKAQKQLDSDEKEY